MAHHPEISSRGGRLGDRLPLVRYLPILVMGFAFAGQPAAKEPAANLPPGAKLYVAPMEWNLDRFVSAEIERQGLSVHLVARAEDADFVMTGVYQSLGSHLISPGHYIQVKIVAAPGGNEVWFGDANDYALFFGRLRPHGPGRAAEAIVKRLHRQMSRR